MTDASVLHPATFALLDATTVTVFDGDVPSRPPADAAGRVYPYAVQWPSPGAAAAEQAVTRATGTDWWCSITVAAGDIGWLLQAVRVVRDALDGATIAEGTTLVDVTPAARTVQRDPDVTPARWYVALAFHALTP